MDQKHHQDFLQIASKTARFYANNCWWADKDELKSEAYLGLLEFYANPPPTFDPSHAGSKNYAQSIASRRLSAWCFAQSSPVSAPPRQQRRQFLAGLTRVSTHEPEHFARTIFARATTRFGLALDSVAGGCDNELVIGDTESEIMALEAAALVPQLHAQLRARLGELYQNIFSDESWDVAEACIDVLAENMKSRDAAANHDVAVRSVYHRTDRLKTRACGDNQVRQLLTQIVEYRGELHDYHA